jgi:flagellar basal-body rod protein FlgG
MIRTLYTAATGMEAQQLKMDVISNNLANASTTGFKKARADFEDLLAETVRLPSAAGPSGGGDPAPLQVGLGVRTGTTSRSFSQGDMIATQNPLDLAIEGNGFFRVTRPNGEPAYTRAGNFRLDSEGRLTTGHGEVVEPGITVPPETLELTVKPDGTVLARLPGRTDLQDLGVLELTTFPNPDGLLDAGSNLFDATEAAGEPRAQRPGESGTGQLAQGYLEGANVHAVEEMVEMISTQRAYELNSKVVQTADQMLQRLTSLR